MSRVLATFLDKPEAHMMNLISSLEKKAGYTSEDVKLLADSAHRVRAKVAELGLDPSDTTGEELYHALLAKFEKDCSIVDKSVGVDQTTPIDQKIEKAISLVTHMEGLGQVWAIKKSRLKTMLSDVGLPKTIKQLGYRTLDSMLKHENSFELLAGASILESTTWQKNLKSKTTKLSTADFELREPVIVLLDKKKWSDLEADNVAVANQHFGSIAISGAKLNNSTSVLALALLLHDEIATLSSKKAAKKITKLNPTLSWWEDTEHLMSWNDGQPISLNFKDLAHAHINELSYKERPKQKASEAFWNELIARYKDKIQDIPAEIAEVEEKTQEVLNPAHQFAVELEEVQD